MGTFCCLRKSRTKSSAARPTPIAIAATIGRVASKVVITSLKPLPPRSRLTSAAPSIQSAGTRQLSKTIIAVSEARIPSLFSTRATVIPGVLCSTMKGLIPARPAFLSTVAHTTTKPSDFSAAIWPAVQKIFVPLITQWSPSRVAVVVIAAESEPHPGSVIAIAPHLGLPSRKPPEETLLLLWRAGRADGCPAESRTRNRQEKPCVAPAQFLGAEAGVEVAQLGPAILFLSGG